jgi:hypothetical protein
MKNHSSYARLRDGSWGAKVPSADVQAGDRITVENKTTGEVKEETVAKVIWTTEDDGGLAICTLRPQDERGERRASDRRREPERRDDRRPDVTRRAPPQRNDGRAPGQRYGNRPRPLRFEDD